MRIFAPLPSLLAALLLSPASDRGLPFVTANAAAIAQTPDTDRALLVGKHAQCIKETLESNVNQEEKIKSIEANLKIVEQNIQGLKNLRYDFLAKDLEALVKATKERINANKKDPTKSLDILFPDYKKWVDVFNNKFMSKVED